MFFVCPETGISNKTGVLPGIDIRGDGGYVVAPPSKHYSGRSYRWMKSRGLDEIELAVLPQWLFDLIQNKQYVKRENSSSFSFEEGRRNDSLFRIASGMRGQGLSSKEIEEELLIENESRCRPPLPKEEVKRIANSVDRYERGRNFTDIDWPKAEPLPPLEVEVPVLSRQMIPEPLQDWVSDVTDRMQSSCEMLMAPVLVVLSGMIGRRLAIKPKQKDDWTEIPNLWGGIISPPSTMKSPAMNEALKPLRRLENESKEKYIKELDFYERLCESDDNYSGVKPVRRRRFTNDATIEKLGELLNENPNGLIVFRDELYGFLVGLEKAGRENDRQFYLESFNGNGGFASDRIGRGTVDTPALCISILGGIQPDRLATYFSETLKNGSSDDGFLSRFQVCRFGAYHYTLRWQHNPSA